MEYSSTLTLKRFIQRKEYIQYNIWKIFSLRLEVRQGCQGQEAAEGPDGWTGKGSEMACLVVGTGVLFASVNILVYLMKFLLQEFSFLLQL